MLGDNVSTHVLVRWTPEDGLSPRRFYILSMVTDYFRSIDPENWVELMGIGILGLDKVIIPGVRFKNKARLSRAWAASSSTHVCIQGNLPGSESHPTETESDNILFATILYTRSLDRPQFQV